MKLGQWRGPTEREIVSETLNLANLREPSDDQVKRLFWWFMCGQAGKIWQRFEADQLEKKFGVPLMKQELFAARDQIRAPLEQMLKKIDTERLRCAAKISTWLAKLEIRGVPKFRRKTLTYEYVITPVTASGPNGMQSILHDIIFPVVGWALALLLDKHRTHGRQLRRCQLDGCENLFLATPDSDGGRPSHYCSKEHTAEARRLQAIQRSKRYRDKHAARHK